MKSSDIDKEILCTLLERIEYFKKKNPSFNVSEKIIEILKNPLNTKSKEYIIFLKEKIEKLIRIQEVNDNWMNLKYLKLEEKEYVLEDINNIETFIEFYYLVIKNISEVIQKYKRWWDNNNLLHRNILFLEKLKDKSNCFKNDNLYIEYKDKLDLILNEINLEIDKNKLENNDFLYKHWRIIWKIILEDKTYIIEKINNKDELIEFYDKFKKTFSVLINKYKSKSNSEKIKLYNYLNSIKNKCSKLNNYGNLDYSTKLTIIKNKMEYFLSKLIIDKNLNQ